jgi:hypothetical protein
MESCLSASFSYCRNEERLIKSDAVDLLKVAKVVYFGLYWFGISDLTENRMFAVRSNYHLYITDT